LQNTETEHLIELFQRQSELSLGENHLENKALSIQDKVLYNILDERCTDEQIIDEIMELKQ